MIHVRPGIAEEDPGQWLQWWLLEVGWASARPGVSPTEAEGGLAFMLALYEPIIRCS